MAARADQRKRPVQVQESPTGKVVVLRLVGDHDLTTSEAVRRALLDLADRPLVVVDLGDCSFLDSSVIGVLVAARKRIAMTAGSLILVHAHGVPARALRLLGLSHLIPCYDREGRQRTSPAAR